MPISCIKFNSTNPASYIYYPYDAQLNFGTGDFTIEWYQYLPNVSQTDNPYLFSIKPPTGVALFLSENGSSNANQISLPGYQMSYSFTSTTPIYNNWIHYAISRYNNKVYTYCNGVLVNVTYPDQSATSDITDTYNYIFNDILKIGVGPVGGPSGGGPGGPPGPGGPGGASNDTNAFNGYLLYFSWVKGRSLYNTTSTITVPTSIPTTIAETVVLLTAAGSLGTLGSTVVNSNTTTVAISGVIPLPPGFVESTPPPPSTPTVSSIMPSFTQISKFSNNSMVYYKSHSLSYGGVRGVTNSRHIAKKT